MELVSTSYRSAGNLKFLSKVMECFMLSQFNEHCTFHRLLPSYQSAYRANYSCETSLLKLCNDALQRMKSKDITILVIMDLSATFDTVDHDILLTVLHDHFGITSYALSWFDTYLNPRQIYVNVECHKSSNKPLNFSVPKGDCGGPTQFMAYSSTLQYVIHQANRIDPVGPDLEPAKCNNPILLNGFADDHCLNNWFILMQNKHKEMLWFPWKAA